MKNLHHASKQEFQVERIVLFSDAVFAIAITLLVIDLKLPELHSITNQSFNESLLLLLPKFTGFVISFFLIGLYWFIHHRMFGYVIHYNGKLIWLNLAFLFSIVLMPFTTSVYSDYSLPKYIHLTGPYSLYVFNVCLTGVLNFLLWRFIGNPRNGVTENFPGGDFLRIAMLRSIMVPAMFFLSLIVVLFIHPVAGRFVLCLIPVVMSLVRNRKDEVRVNM